MESTSPDSHRSTAAGRWRVVLAAIGLILVVLIVRLVFLDNVGTEAFHDENLYLTLASIIRGETEGPPGSLVGKPPLYPLFVAGAQTLLHGNTREIKILQAILFSLGAWFLFELIRMLFGLAAAVVGTLVYATYVPFIGLPLLLMSEALFLPLMAFHLGLLLRAESSPRPGRWLLSAGIVGGLACLTRDVLLPFLALFTILLAIRIPARGFRGWRRALPLTVGIVLTVGPWTVRNYVRHHAFVPVSTVAFSNLWFFSTKDSTGLKGSEFIQEQWEAEGSVADREVTALREGLGRTLGKPGTALSRVGRNSWRFLGAPYVDRGYFVRRLFRKPGLVPKSWLGPLLMVRKIQYAFILTIGVIGLWISGRSIVKTWTLLFLPYSFLVHGLTLVKERFAWPWIMLLIVFGSVCFPRLASAIRNRRLARGPPNRVHRTPSEQPRGGSTGPAA